MMRLLVSAVLVCGFAGAAMAESANPGPIPQGPPSSTPPTTAVATPGQAVAPTGTSDDDTIVCHYERQTGTLFQKRICHTNREWKQRTQDAHDLMNRMEDASAMGQRGS